MELIVFAFSLDLSAENSNLSAVSGNQRNQLFRCMGGEYLFVVDNDDGYVR